ncbi:MAG: ribosome-associated toxin RatA of RatAB toxin-antitoxin module [Patescibacteria group bacterium]|jgi:ribosome-associated toxin RatA of RatAB toxin-antitoxin module
MKNTIFFFAICCLFLSSCQTATESKETEAPISENPMDNLPRIWQLRDYDLINAEGNLDASQKESLEGKVKREGLQFCFIPNQTGNSITGEIYEEFIWDFNVADATIIMKKKSSENKWTDVRIEKGGKSWKLTATENNIAKIELIGSASLTANIAEEPFHPLNNQWRVKATKYEEVSALKERLLNFVTHYKYLFKASIDNPKRSFTNSKSGGIILIYKGAIAFVGEKKIPTEWSYAFYDEYQAKDTYKLFKKYMNNKTITKEALSDWKPVNLQILRELETKIKADIAGN